MTGKKLAVISGDEFAGICYSVPRSFSDILPDRSIFSHEESNISYFEAEARRGRARALKRVSNMAARRYS